MVFDFGILAASTDATTAAHAVTSNAIQADDAGVSLGTCASTNTCPGVYDNAWADLDTTPHTWTPPVEIDPGNLDNPYASWSQLSYDGTCNPLPGWNPSFNPSSDIGCRVNPMYNEPGLGYGASYGSLGHAVTEHASATGAAAHAVSGGSQLYDTAYPGICDPMPGWQVTWNPPDCSTQVEPDVRGLMPSAAWTQTEQLALPIAPDGTATATATAAGAAVKPSRPSPGHLLLCGHAAIFGAFAATSSLLSEALRGGAPAAPADASVPAGAADMLARWGDKFRQETSAAAAAVTPVGAFVLREHVFHAPAPAAAAAQPAAVAAQ